MKKEIIFESIPANVRRIGKVLARSGEESYLVGGAIRDILSGRPCNDFDLATTATPQKVSKLFEHVIPTGIRHGTVTILLSGKGYEITTLRGEGTYSDGRRPDTIEFIDDIELDLARRDFTINAMAWDLKQNRLHDPFGGQQDLQGKIIRAVGNPRNRFEEDALRALRAARFAATLAYEVERETLLAIPPINKKLALISGERKQFELARLLDAEKPSLGLRVIEQGRLLRYLCPKWDVFLTQNTGHPNRSDWEKTLGRVDALPMGPRLRLAGLLLHGIDTEHLPRSGTLPKKWLKEMRFEKKVIESVSFLIKHHGFSEYGSWSDHKIRRFVSAVGRSAIPELLELKRCSIIARGAPPAELNSLDRLTTTIENILTSKTPLTIGELAIGGKDLIEELGLAPGPQIGKILDNLLKSALRDPGINERSRLLTAARAHAAHNPED